MTKRLDRAKRIMRAQKQLHRIAELEEIRLSRELEELKGSQREIVSALNDDEKLQGVFIASADQALKRVSRKVSSVETLRDAATATLFEKSTSMKLAEKRLKAAQADASRQEEKDALSDLIQLITQKENSSFP